MLICVSAMPAHAGDATSGTARNWLISAYGGVNFGGPSQNIEDAMSESGFDARSPGGFGSFGSDHPFTRDDGGTWMLAATRFVKRPFSVGVLYGRMSFGETSGYHSQVEGLVIEYGGDVVALVVFANDRSFLRSFLQEELFELSIGLGPAVYRTRAKNISSRVDLEENKATKIGLLVDLELKFPANSRVFAAANLQYRLVGTMEVGPYTATALFDPGVTAVLPETETSFDHFFAGFSVGIRL
jgi:hypothetical protein